jgi:hypothetical protein
MYGISVRKIAWYLPINTLLEGEVSHTRILKEEFNHKGHQEHEGIGEKPLPFVSFVPRNPWVPLWFYFLRFSAKYRATPPVVAEPGEMGKNYPQIIALILGT